MAPSWIRFEALAKKPVFPKRPLMSMLLLLYRFAVVAAAIHCRVGFEVKPGEWGVPCGERTQIPVDVRA